MKPFTRKIRARVGERVSFRFDDGHIESAVVLARNGEWYEVQIGNDIWTGYNPPIFRT